MSQMLPLRPVDRDGTFEARRFQVFTARNMDKIPGLDRMPEDERFAMRVVANVLPFRVNEYVINELIDWEKAPDDPIYQLTIPQRGMLAPALFDRMADVLRRDASREEINRVAWEIRNELNPHPAGQMKLNVPQHDGEKLEGMQHKYNETVLFFPSQGQVCHSYCTFCFRWAQFVGDKDLQFASNEAERLHAYLRDHREVSDLLLTGGDPMVMKTRKLEEYLDPLLAADLEHVQTVRLGTKALTFWPYRFVTDKDADDLLRLFERLVNSGRHVALMAHYNHPQELKTPIAEEAIRRIRDTGVEIRAQGPLLAHINDSSEAWAELWRKQVRLGIIPYYMFVERDTGARHYFEVPLARAWEIYRDAMKQVSGLGRTARGPSMSAGPGKVEVQGITEVQGEKVFVLRFIQGRNPDWVQRPFFAKFDPNATWLDQLQPAFGEDKFFFQDEYDAMLASVESD
ncbi:KamA family radical SAM protein [Alkalilimnicola ehrlichii MLHE-1]|uniref:L-lysine 2,3-aminomutase n=1 Tax=Alkalilimnicola ehrlichii (strain ATCC BAA-1101 / DSM 17681 / MLHE-1) TaxID=187272 RepID=Q0A9F3_ALKEH|nr:lysine 2,3-aminomutase [Alkalilimnicola ehrlichii]ABI56534.1 L-lysine 2,3-aminomutase [Alkalilimnicola ehrlichii MLHE-1]